MQTWSKFISQHVKDDPEQVLHSICENYKPQTTSFKCPSTAELRTMKPVDFQIELTKALKSYEKASVSKLKEQPYIVNKLNDMMREVKDREPSVSLHIINVFIEYIHIYHSYQMGQSWIYGPMYHFGC